MIHDLPLEARTPPSGWFNHHPDAAIDFCIEVEEIESIHLNEQLGLTGFGHEADRANVDARIAKAMQFRVGGDLNCIAAKSTLRRIETERRAA